MTKERIRFLFLSSIYERKNEMNQKGITLIEILISLVVASIILAGAYRVLISESQVYTVQDAVAGIQNDARAAMEIMVSDLRMAGYDKEGGGSTVVVSQPVSGGAHNITVQWEENDTTVREVRYYLLGNQLMRAIYFNNAIANDSPHVVLDGVSDLTFSYDISGVIYIRADISLTLQANRLDREVSRTLVSSVMFRNAK